MNKVVTRFSALLFALVGTAIAEVPHIVNHQGFVTAGEPPKPLTGAGEFKFGIVDESGLYLWTNDGSHLGEAASSPPDAATPLEVKNGIYSLGLGDESLKNMKSIPSEVFSQKKLYLRIFLNDRVHGEEQLRPDRPFTSVPFSYQSENADYALESEHAVSADEALLADESRHSESATKADKADHATNAETASNANHANNADRAKESDRASVATAVRGNFAGGIIASVTDGGVKSLSINRLDCLDGDNIYPISTQTTIVKRADAPFAPGTGNGGIQAGTALENGKFVYVFAIGSSADSNIADFLLVPGGTLELPSGYDIARFLGSRLWENNQFVRYLETFNGRNRKVSYMTPKKVQTDLVSSSFVVIDVSHYVPARACEIEILAVARRESSGLINIYVRPTPVPLAVGTTPEDSTLLTTANGTRASGIGVVPIEETLGFEYAVSAGTKVDFYVRSYTESL